MFTRDAMIKGIAKKTKAKKTKAKKGVFFKNKKIAKNAEDMFTKMMQFNCDNMDNGANAPLC